MAKDVKKSADDRAKLLGRITPVEAQSNGDGLYPDVPECAEAFPILNALLTVTEVDGKKRKGATITFWVEAEGLRAVMSDRSANRKLWACAPSLMGLLGELEAALESPRVDWRNDAGTKWKGRS